MDYKLLNEFYIKAITPKIKRDLHLGGYFAKVTEIKEHPNADKIEIIRSENNDGVSQCVAKKNKFYPMQTVFINTWHSARKVRGEYSVGNLITFREFQDKYTDLWASICDEKEEYYEEIHRINVRKKTLIKNRLAFLNILTNDIPVYMNTGSMNDNLNINLKQVEESLENEELWEDTVDNQIIYKLFFKRISENIFVVSSIEDFKWSNFTFKTVYKWQKVHFKFTQKGLTNAKDDIIFLNDKFETTIDDCKIFVDFTNEDKIIKFIDAPKGADKVQLLKNILNKFELL